MPAPAPKFEDCMAKAGQGPPLGCRARLSPCTVTSNYIVGDAFSYDVLRAKGRSARDRSAVCSDSRNGRAAMQHTALLANSARMSRNASSRTACSFRVRLFPSVCCFMINRPSRVYRLRHCTSPYPLGFDEDVQRNEGHQRSETKLRKTASPYS
jgi:hypothetical protein